MRVVQQLWKPRRSVSFWLCCLNSCAIICPPQENLVEAIERAAAALRVVHDESQSRELRSLITIRRASPKLSIFVRDAMLFTHHSLLNSFCSVLLSAECILPF